MQVVICLVSSFGLPFSPPPWKPLDLVTTMIPSGQAQPMRQHRPSLLSMQHNFDNQDGDDEMRTAPQDKTASPVPPIRRVHSYSGESSNPGDEERASFGFRSGEDPMAARRTLSALEPSFSLPPGPISGPRSMSMNTVPLSVSPARSSGLVGPSIPLALRRASSDQHGGHVDMQETTSAGTHGKGGFGVSSSQSAFTAGWPSSSSARMPASGNSPTTPPRAAVFNPGSPSNTHTSLGMNLSSAPGRGIGARARANSGTRRGPGGAFGTPPMALPNADARKRSGSGSGNGAWHARANVSLACSLPYNY